MVNEYVKDDIMFGNDSHVQENSDDEIYDEPMKFQDWLGYYGDDLHNMWWELHNYLSSTGAGIYMLNRCDFSTFCEFCYNNSSGIQYFAPVGKK